MAGLNGNNTIKVREANTSAEAEDQAWIDHIELLENEGLTADKNGVSSTKDGEGRNIYYISEEDGGLRLYGGEGYEGKQCT